MLPSFADSGALVDVADRQALYEAMEGRQVDIPLSSAELPRTC